MVGLGANTSAVETSVVSEEGEVLRKCEAGLYSSVISSLVVNSFADVGTLVRGIKWVVASICTRFLSVVMVPSVEICGTRISGLVGKSCFPAVVCTTMGSVIRTSVLDKVLGLVTKEWEVLRLVVVKVGDIWAKLVLMAGRAGLVKDSVKAVGKGTLEGALTVTTLVASVGRDTRLGDFASVMICFCCGML